VICGKLPECDTPTVPLAAALLPVRQIFTLAGRCAHVRFAAQADDGWLYEPMELVTLK